jgi:hypothetical protein
MPVVSRLLARLLMLLDQYLAVWVDVNAPTANASPNGCWEFEIQNVTLNACGQEYIGLFHFGGLSNGLQYIISIIPSAMGTIMTLTPGPFINPTPPP